MGSCLSGESNASAGVPGTAHEDSTRRSQVNEAVFLCLRIGKIKILTEPLGGVRLPPFQSRREALTCFRSRSRYRYPQDECWIVVGDSVSGRHAEDFRLFRHRERQFGAFLERQGLPKRSDPTKDVLWAPTDSLSYIDGNGVDLFGGKTQGYPYHLAILAVAILLETRFSDKCYLFGDIEPIQVGHMCHWVHKTLNTPLITPICLDGKRLYRRISALYEDPHHAIERFQVLFAGSEVEKFESLLRYAERQTVFDVFMEELGGYSSFNQYGAIQLVSKFLSATRNLEELIEIVLRIAEQGKKTEEWNLEALLRMLCRHYLTFACEERKPLDVLDQDELITIDDALSQAFMIAAGKPTKIDAYKKASDVLKTFCSVQPEKRAVFQALPVLAYPVNSIRQCALLPQGATYISPGLRRSSYPGSARATQPTLKGLRHCFPRPPLRNPVGVGSLCLPFPG
uniref:Uncharacterized protein n=1 Tax=Candidatus Kentrum sp. TUN TaxID=2126343 RepID=A0A450ZN40_9GAMM|nr:MAG: hypothetical protein BECKTUN1418D_GA0071000_102912 [Candidatus Kentron sp. TUN]